MENDYIIVYNFIKNQNEFVYARFYGSKDFCKKDKGEFNTRALS